MHVLREVFNALRYLVWAGCPWRGLPPDLPPWEMVYQQSQRWIKAGVFETMCHDLRALLRLVAGRAFSWIARYRCLARDYERLPTTLAGLTWMFFASLLLARFHL